jgi:hypothetical protein
MESVKQDSDRRMEAVKQLSETMWTGFERRQVDKNIKVKEE